jgi:ABC-2 type transport system ATP-binding protein
MTHPAIETKDLSKRFGDVIAADSVDLPVEPGKIFDFLSPNGTRKPTTINVLLDFVKPTSSSGVRSGYS